MPKRDKKVYLEDILNSCKELQQLRVDAGSISSFLSKNYFYRTAERCFQIIGEALYHLNNLDKTIPITEKTKIIRLKHMIMIQLIILDCGFIWNNIYLLYTKKPNNCLKILKENSW